MFFSYCRLSIKKYTKGRELSMTSCCLVFVDFDSKSSIPKCIHDLVTSGRNAWVWFDGLIDRISVYSFSLNG